MSVSDLQCLLSSIRETLEERESEVRVNTLKKLKSSGKLKELKAELKALKADAKAMTKAQTFAVNIPVTFTVSGEVYNEFFEELTAYDHVYWSDMLYLGVSGKVGEGLNKAQAKLIQGVLDEILPDACEDFMILFPDLLAQRDALEKRASSFMKEMEKAEIGVEDL
jgi:hypothetical protein